jgi:hypothetical protein
VGGPGASHLGTRETADLNGPSAGNANIPATGFHAASRPLRFDLDNAEAMRRVRRTHMLQPVATTEGEKVKITCVFVTDQSSRHWWKAYNKPESMWKENRKASAKACAIPGAQMRGTRGNQHLWENSPYFHRQAGHSPLSYPRSQKLDRGIRHELSQVS